MGMYAITSGELILDEIELHEPDVSIVSKVEAYVEGERLYIKGKLYKKNTDSYKQRAYLKVVDDAGRSSYQYVTLYKVEKEPDKLNALVSDAMKDIQEEIELQSLVTAAMAEFQGIHQEMVRQQERAALAEKQRQQEKERQRIAEQKQQKPDKGWSFSR